MTTFPTILVAVDGRPGGRDAMALARALGGPKTQFVLVHAWTIDAMMLLDRSEESRRLVERERERSGMEAVVDEAGHNSTLHALQDLVDRHAPDLVVLGASHRSALGRHLLGDVGRAALHRLHCAVAFAPAGYAERQRPVSTVAAAWNDTPESGPALTMARELAREHGASLRALTVVPAPTAALAVPGPVVGVPPEVLESDLEPARERFRSMPDVDGQVVTGPPALALREFSREVDLLVLGSHRRGALRRLLLGSTADAVVHHAGCPVLVLPPPLEDPTATDDAVDATP